MLSQNEHHEHDLACYDGAMIHIPLCFVSMSVYFWHLDGETLLITYMDNFLKQKTSSYSICRKGPFYFRQQWVK